MDEKVSNVVAENPKGGMLAMYWERYGWAAVIAFLGLLALQLLVLTPMIRFGVDISPLTTWIHDTLGFGDGTVGPVKPSWVGAFIAAYVTTRAFKPFTLPLALALTPVIAGWLGHTGPAEPPKA